MEQWNPALAEEEYVRGAESYGALASRWGVDARMVERTGRELGWYLKRIRFRQGRQSEDEPLEILRTAAYSLCRCAGQAAKSLESRDEPPGKGDLKSLHEAATLLKDLVGLIQNLYGEEKTNEVRICMEGEINGFCN